MKNDEMRDEYDFSKGKRGFLFGKVTKKTDLNSFQMPVGTEITAVCINTPDLSFLTPRKIYSVKFFAENLVEVVDEEGEKEIYPARYFMPLALSPEVEKALANIAVLENYEEI